MDNNNRWEEIYENYQEYTDRYQEEGDISIGSGGLPLQSAILSESIQNAVIMGNVGPLERELLLENNPELPNVHSLSYDDLLYLPIGLTEALKVQITEDHKEFWRFTADIANETEYDDFSLDEDLLRQFELLVALVLSEPMANPLGRERWSEEWMREEILWQTNPLASYAGFPVLEGFLKSICSEYICMDGTVKPDKTIKTYNGCYTGGDICSNFGHLLYHVEKVVARQSQQERMKMMRERIASFLKIDAGAVYGADGLSQLRNSWLHGEEQADAETGIILNYISLFLWDEIDRKDLV